MSDSFARLHPLVNFLYFTLVLAFSMAVRHPLAQCVSLVCSLWYAVRQGGTQAVGFSLKFCLPMMLLTAIVNPLFSHQGTTVLLTLPSGNPLTLESILYGISSGVMLATVFLWFLSFNRVITSDKFLYLFGRSIPALSLVLSMTLRFVPRFRVQLAAVTEAQRSIGRDVSRGNLRQRLRTAVTILSILVTWALENAIDTADSMKSRGYGLPGRTAFSIYRFDRRDQVFLGWVIACGIFLTCGTPSGAFPFPTSPSYARSCQPPWH